SGVRSSSLMLVAAVQGILMPVVVLPRPSRESTEAPSANPIISVFLLIPTTSATTNFLYKFTMEKAESAGQGYFISGLAVPTYLTGRKSRSLGIVLKSRAIGFPGRNI